MAKTQLDILMVIEGEIATTHLIERILMACKQHGVCYRKQFLSALKVKDIHPNTIPLFVRCGDPSLEFWIEVLQQAKHPYLYYIDDNFWQIQGDSPIAKYYRHPVIRRSLEFAVTHASSLLTNSNELACFLTRFNKRVELLPAFFDFSLIKGCTGQITDEIRIGFAGSPSRANDLDIIRPIIFPILEEFPNTVFEFAGIMPQGIEPSDRVRFFPHTTDYSAFVRFQVQRNWSIGLAPLIDNESNRCKTNNKYREYGACKIAGIYSDLQPYKRSVIPSTTGLLVENSTEAWHEAIRRLVANQLERDQMGQRAYKDVREKYCVELVSNVWTDCFENVDMHNCALLQKSTRRMRLKKLRLYIDTLRMQIVATHNVGGFPLIIKKSIKRLIQMASS